MANRHFNLRTISTFANGNNEEYMTVYYVRPSFAPTCFFFLQQFTLISRIAFQIAAVVATVDGGGGGTVSGKTATKKKYIEKP